MGPRSRERGKDRQSARVRAPHSASMGPRSRERGKTSTMQRGTPETEGFNGAAFARTRKGRSPAERIDARKGLQWGRVRENAERARRAPRGGDDQCASMGPRSRERGKLSNALENWEC